MNEYNPRRLSLILPAPLQHGVQSGSGHLQVHYKLSNIKDDISCKNDLQNFLFSTIRRICFANAKMFQYDRRACKQKCLSQQTVFVFKDIPLKKFNLNDVSQTKTIYNIYYINIHPNPVLVLERKSSDIFFLGGVSRGFW